jgi:putative ABC transport system permease protein
MTHWKHEIAPLAGGLRTAPVTVAGGAQLADRPLQASVTFVSADYFQTRGLRITRGRSFTEQEAQANAPVVLISESTARRFWPDIRDLNEALGKQIGVPFAPRPNEATANASPKFPQREVIGITNDTRQIWVWQRDDTFLYLPLQAFSDANEARTGKYLLVSTESDPRPVMTAARKEAAAVDPNLDVLPRRLEDSLTFQMAPFRAVALLSSVLGVLALLLASVGLYGCE